MKISAETVGVIFYQSTFHLLLPRRHRDIVSLNTILTKQNHEKTIFSVRGCETKPQKTVKIKVAPYRNSDAAMQVCK